MSHVLVVDDELGVREMLRDILRDEGFTVTLGTSGEEALAAVTRDLFDAVLLDVWLPGLDGIETMRQLRASGYQVPVVVISGHATAELAARAIREGAVDFLEKPFSLERVVVSVQNAVDHARLRERVAAEVRQEEPRLTGVSKAVQGLRRQILLAAPTDARVLITGEHGAGKEVVARLLHVGSRRSQGPFVAVNCAAIPSELIESELFGHLKGAFTGAVESRRGKFEVATGGTLFLDEIGDMSLMTQAKVLRVLQESRLTRLGGAQEVGVDVRVIAATNKDLEAEIAGGRFREDLLFRLNVIPISVPALRERREDIPLLVEEISQQFARDTGSPPKRIDVMAMEALAAYAWPGNVREVRNVIERLMVMVDEEIVRPHHLGLGSGVRRQGDRRSLKAAREDFERSYILETLDRCRGNVSQAARELGLERSHLYRKLRALGVRLPRG